METIGLLIMWLNMNHTNKDDDMEARNDPIGYVTFYHRKYRIPRYYFHYNKLFC